VRAYADDVRTALNRIDESMPADVTQDDIERDVRHASEEVRQERLRRHAELLSVTRLASPTRALLKLISISGSQL
jgi:hypothetical protein